MNTKIISAYDAVRRLVTEQSQIHQDIWYPTLFGGDRLTCCDEAAIVEIDGKIAAIATIAPEGEMTSGEPTIVGLYTVRSFRRQGCGKAVLEAAIRRGTERGFPKIRIDVLTKNAMKTIHSLPEDLRSSLSVHDQSAFCCFLE